MAQYRLYRHPLHGVVAVRDGGWQSLLGREPRLLREGYSYSGSAEAASAQAAMTQSVRGGSAAIAKPPLLRNQTARPAAVPAQVKARAGQFVGTVTFFVFLIAAAISVFSKRGAHDTAMPEPASAEFPLGAFGPWLDFNAVTRESRQVDTRRYLLSGVESRMHEGEGQCRLRYAAVDPEHPVQWRWWCAQSDEDFARLHREYTAEGYAVAQRHVYADPAGWSWHSAVWYREARR